MPELEGDWDTVHGELVTLPIPERDLPPLDRLEGLRPNGHGLHPRALVAVRGYHMAGIDRGQRLSCGVWPASRAAANGPGL
jgi:hypothetical protein